MDDLYVIRFAVPTGSDAPALDEREDETPDEKTTFAHFGLAMYMASVFEHGLVNAFALAQLLIARESAERLLADPWDEGFKKRMTDLVRAAVGHSAEAKDVSEELTRAVRRRNALVHAFWREHAVDFCSEVGRGEMIAELIAARQQFKSADERLDAVVTRPLRARGGVTDEAVGRLTEEMRSQAVARDLLR